ncbi:MAG: DUF3450 domain-containing protein [Gammaproteobacteria bacterium]|nr:DUF3450 domain-containing protein [Gammaproteobacteria bacterium]
MSFKPSSLSQVIGVICLALSSFTPASNAAVLNDSQQVISQTNNEAVRSQQNVDRLAGETRVLLEEYRRVQNSAEYQEVYTRELQQLKASQLARIESLKRQVEEAGITQQRIVPLMRSMADSLEKFVVLDLPFHHEERINAVLQLKQRLRKPDLALSVKFRLLLETWQIEQDYGVTIETWPGPLELPDSTLSVEFLRIGRVALYYQSRDGLSSGYWEKSEKRWIPLTTHYNQQITRALRVARDQVSPELLNLPMAPPGAGR